MRAIALCLVIAACDSNAGAPDTIVSSTEVRTSPVAPPPPTVTSATATDRAKLRFVVEGKTVRSIERSALVATLGSKTFTAYDPYYSKPKTFRAIPLEPLLTLGFEGVDLVLPEQHFVLRATDGYTVPIEGSRLLEDGGHIAIEDVDTPSGWQAIGPQQVSPGPYYLVWSKPNQQDLTTHPRPWQLATIEVSKFEDNFPKTVPTGESPTSPAWAGFKIYREQCIRCHAVNQEGGRVGPELNVPQNITEYRPVDQIRAYIKNPRTFRYGNMPANPHLDEDDLDSLIAYFKAMRARKQDPDAPAH